LWLTAQLSLGPATVFIGAFDIDGPEGKDQGADEVVLSLPSSLKIAPDAHIGELDRLDMLLHISLCMPATYRVMSSVVAWAPVVDM
jgi:hypothetical protein